MSPTGGYYSKLGIAFPCLPFSAFLLNFSYFVFISCCKFVLNDILMIYAYECWNKLVFFGGNTLVDLVSVNLYCRETVPFPMQTPIKFCILLHRPVIGEDLKELIQLMLDKNPETRITIPEIKVRQVSSCSHPNCKITTQDYV